MSAIIKYVYIGKPSNTFVMYSCLREKKKKEYKLSFYETILIFSLHFFFITWDWSPCEGIISTNECKNYNSIEINNKFISDINRLEVFKW